MAQKLVVIGNGMAPGRMLENLFETAPGLYDVTIFNAEPRVNYDRIMLSPVLSGEKSYDDIIIHGDEWYETNNVTLHKGEKVSLIDRENKIVTSENGVTAAYDKLVIATGSSPFIIPVPGHQLPGVLAYRDLDDVSQMLDIAARGGRAIVIGAGLLGLEAAYGLKRQGMDVTVIHLMPTIMERQLDPASAYLLEKALTDRGIDIITKANTKRILGENKVEGIELDDGRIIKGDMVVMAVGIRPASGLAKEAGLAVNRGIVVDDGMMTSDASIYALGECAEHRGMCYGLVAPLYESARILADRLTGGHSEYHGSVTNTKLKVTGINLFSAGDFTEGDDREEIVLRDATAGIYKRLVLKDNRIIGAVLYGETSDGSWFFDMLKKGTDVSQMRDTLIFGQAYQGGSPLDPAAAVAALPADAEICGYNPAAVQPMCKCTDLGHDDVRRLIKAKGLKTIPAVMQELEWKTSCGCAKCRPALNYYLVCDWPDEYADDYQSRFINERVHANIQKDGTYSVVPRMWGGVTNAGELRAIADVVDKFEIPLVKVTGGQRIDLLGIEKEDLPAVWADLGKAGFISGQAYAKGLRTVKTCVGQQWCRFGTQDSTGFGVRIEKFMWGSWTPAKLKLAVSGCPRNCAEATCKDIGVICVDSGFEIHFAGAAGLDIKGTEILGLVKSEDEALEHIVALTQMYREQARYLERIYKWAKRIGYDEVRRQIMEDDQKRRAYYDRFVFSQKFAQVDPWSERVSGEHKHEFKPMATIGFNQAAE
ncbi:NAD(P)/FAD-dependent oxidoreductase [Agrobacterium sp.]|uniref:NAD(P)/FAD-dependent oxidoreductase n=1 Tax=Agrobacterium sp. TaxID=361 RepID=UPI0028A79AF0|nr:NAD(P)/FAD-dependent oxidoreductase [Agrobacterium sp.]